MASGDQTCSRGAANRVRYVSIRAENAVRRDGIDIRRRVIRAAIETYISVTQIVRQNDDDVGRRRLRQGGGDRSTNDEERRQKKFLYEKQAL